ncbi:MAG: hypothetical protein ACRDQ7_03240 [Haloechinothrix sp.]
MTTTTSRTDAAPVRPTRFRLIVGYATILGTIPYLALKFAWLCGSEAGITDPDFARDPSMFALNLFTAGMDVVAIVLALVFTHAWGQRAPAWLVLFPIWVGTGFLAPIVIGAPVIGAGLAVEAGPPADAPRLPLADWVQPVVYASFIWQGLTLLTAFVLYTRARWPRLYTARTVPIAGRVRPLIVAGVLLAGFAAGVHLLWASGSGLGLPPELVRTLSGALVQGLHGAMALASVTGAILLGWGGGRFRVPMPLAWTGAGAMFSWGLWSVLNTVASTALVSGGVLALPLAVGCAQLAGGACLGLVLVAAARSVLAVPQHQGEAHQEHHGECRDHGDL